MDFQLFPTVVAVMSLLKPLAFVQTTRLTCYGFTKQISLILDQHMNSNGLTFVFSLHLR